MKDENYDNKDLESVIGYRFENTKLLETALTHSSYANEIKEKGRESNERLEFLGDAVLQLTISHYLYEKYPDQPEGELTKLRSNIVCEPTLAKASAAFGFGQYLKLGKGEDSTGGRNRDSILADLFEAILGAVYLDGGLKSARAHVLRLLEAEILNLTTGARQTDAKTALQEIIQQNSKQPLVYHVVSESGPEHNKSFVSEVSHEGELLGRGEGKTKKEAEQNAAAAGLIKMQHKK